MSPPPKRSQTWQEYHESDAAQEHSRLTALEERGRYYDAEFERLNNAFDDLRLEMSRGFDAVFNKIDQNTAQRQITWPLIFAAVTTLLGVLGVGSAFHAQSLRPISANVAWNQSGVEKLREEVVGMGKKQAGIAVLLTEVQRHAEAHAAEANHPYGVLTELAPQVGHLRGRLDEMEKTLREIDQYGSRRWIDKEAVGPAGSGNGQ